MGKRTIRQAVKYERKLTAQTQTAQHDLLAQSIEYERRLTNAQLHEVATVSDEHQRFHEREHLLYDDAVETASTSLAARISTLEADLERVRIVADAAMTVDRFEREHKALLDRVETGQSVLSDRLMAEQRVTIGQETRDEVLSNVTQSRRWAIATSIAIMALLIGNGLTLLALLLHLIGAY